MKFSFVWFSRCMGLTVAAIALDFLANPNQTPDSSCPTQINPLFVVE